MNESPARNVRTDAARRGWLLAAAGSTAALALPGCGFALRRPPTLRFATIHLAGFRPRSPLADELRQRLEQSPTTRVVAGAATAQVVLEALDDSREKVVVLSNSVGRITEFQLRERFTFSARATNGRALIPPTALAQTRDLSYTETAALAKEQEEEFLYRAMQRDLVDQVLRRLVALDVT